MNAHDEQLTLAEQRLRGLLGPLADDDSGGEDFSLERLVRIARWQRAIRVPLAFAGLVGAALADALHLLGAGDRRRPS